MTAAGGGVPKRGRAVSVVIPAFNEEDAIAETLEGVRAAIAQSECEQSEIVVVDDGSSDRTAEIAEANGARVLRKPLNIGYGHSLKLGIDAAHHDTIVILDADGTYPIQQIPRLLGLYRDGYNMVVGERTGEHYRQSWFKAPMRHILRFIVEFTTGRRIPDPNSGMRIFSKAEISALFPYLSNSFSFTISSTLAYILNSYYVAYAKIPYYRRIGKSKVRLLRDSLRVLQFVISAVLLYNPIKMFLIVCMALALVGVPLAVIGFFAGSFWTTLFGIFVILSIVPTFVAGLVVEGVRQYLLHPNGTHGPGRAPSARPASRP